MLKNKVNSRTPATIVFIFAHLSSEGFGTLEFGKPASNFYRLLTS